MASFRYHCAIGFLVRMFMIVFGVIQDELMTVKYTDIDYKVFTDAANHIVKGNSPYDRYTYRYSPLLAYLLIPNIILHPVWGKILFSICDIIICVLIRKLLKIEQLFNEKLISWCVFFWLYNPMIIIISTRGNADSLSSLLVLSTLLMMRKGNYVLAGVLHGVSVHFRVYPIAFSLCMYLSIENTKTQFKDLGFLRNLYQSVTPTVDRMKLVLSCILTLFLITTIFYIMYGYKFIFESFLYHLNRRDVRHNFSVYFYLQYLSSVSGASLVQRLLVVLPQFSLLLIISSFYNKVRHLYFCHFLIAFVIVTFNTVLTCQYFMWFLCIMPLIIPNLRIQVKETITLVSVWAVAQAAWLLPAYLLEFRNQNMFIYIWFQSLVFFCVNVFVISKIIQFYKKQVKYH